MPFVDYESVDLKTKEKLDQFYAKSYKRYWAKKRIFDIVFSGFLLLVSLPFLLIIALIIYIDDPKGSPIFKQTRVGRHGKEFCMYKFRTMRVDAEDLLESLKDKNEMDGPVFKIKNDPRITRVGHILRKTALDETLQFINVLKGDMTMVGPRPPLPREVALYSDYHKLRLMVTPGITGAWQIHSNRNDIPFEKWMEMDLDYILNRSFKYDFKIIFRTPWAMITATGR